MKPSRIQEKSPSLEGRRPEGQRFGKFFKKYSIGGDKMPVYAWMQRVAVGSTCGGRRAEDCVLYPSARRQTQAEVKMEPMPMRAGASSDFLFVYVYLLMASLA